MTPENLQTPQINTIEDVITQIDELGCWNCLEGGFGECGLAVLQTPYVKLDKTHGIVLQIIGCIGNDYFGKAIQTRGLKLVISILDEDNFSKNVRFEINRDINGWFFDDCFNCLSFPYFLITSLILFVYHKLNDE